MAAADRAVGIDGFCAVVDLDSHGTLLALRINAYNDSWEVVDLRYHIAEPFDDAGELLALLVNEMLERRSLVV